MNFGHVEFEVLVGYLNGYDRQTIRYVDIKRERSKLGVIHLRVINI